MEFQIQGEPKLKLTSSIRKMELNKNISNEIMV